MTYEQINYRHLSTPWATRSQLYSKPGSVILKLALGEAPETIPAAEDVRVGACQAASHTGLNPVDHVLAHFSDRAQVARVFGAAASVGRIGQRHRAFDDLEQVLGLSRTFRIEVDPDCCVDDIVDALRQASGVEQASPHYLCTLPFAARARTPSAPIAIDLPSVGWDWSERRQIRAVEALAYETGDPSVIIAVADTGVAQRHHELRGRLREGGIDTVQLSTTHLARGIELVGDLGGVDVDPEDNVGHGTSCAAIIAAVGERMPPGLAGDCRVLPVRVLGAARFPGKRSLAGIGAMSDIDSGVKNCIDLGAKVINMSFGTPIAALDAHDPMPHGDVVRYGLEHNCVMVAASGNSGRIERYSPATLEEVIAVGAVDQNNQPAPFNTGGDHVDICAPGVRVLSAGIDGYQLVTGTSFAAPFVAATAGLLVSRANRRAYPLNSAAVRRILRASAEPWPDEGILDYGAGTLNAYGALRELDREIDSGFTSPFSTAMEVPEWQSSMT